MLKIQLTMRALFFSMNINDFFLFITFIVVEHDVQGKLIKIILSVIT